MPDTRRSLSALQTLFADNTAGDISAQDGRDELISSHPESVIQTSAFASPPSSPLTGDLWLPTNSFYLLRYSGSAWVPWGPTFPMTQPVNGDFSWVNQGGASVSTTNGGICLTVPSNSGNSLRLRVKTAPATPYTVTAHLIGSFFPGQYKGFGIVFRQSSDGKITPITVYDQAGDNYIAVGKWTDTSTFSANYVASSLPGARSIFLRMSDDGTNRKSYISHDGVNFVLVHSVSRTDFLTADQIGWFGNCDTTQSDGYVTLTSWKEE